MVALQSRRWPAAGRAVAAACLLALPLAACGDSGPVVTTFDGRYTGTAFDTSSPVYACPPTQAASPMTVSQGRVALGTFRGQVSPAGTVRMLSSRDILEGQFSAAGFDGQLSLGLLRPSGVFCTYRMELARQ